MRSERRAALVLALQQRLKKQQALAAQLRKENAALREQEANLSATIGALGDGLYYLSKVLMECPGGGSSSSTSAANSLDSGWNDALNTNSVVAALAQDLQAAELLGMIGKDAAASGNCLTTKSMRSGCTAARVREAQALLAADAAAFEKQVVQKLQQLTFRMSFHLSRCTNSNTSSGSNKLQLLQCSLDDLAYEYVEYVMLMFCVDGKLLPRMCMKNLDTLQEALAPAGLFEEVVHEMRLTKEQIRRFSAAARADGQKRAVLAPKMKQLVAEIQQLLDPQHSSTVTTDASVAATSAAGVAGDKAKQQQQQQQHQTPAELVESGSNSSGRDQGESRAAGSEYQSGSAAFKREVSFQSSSTFQPAPWQRFGLASNGPFYEEDSLQRLEELLVQLQRDLTAWRILNHNMTLVFLNTSTHEQLARATVAAYPFFLQPFEVIRCVLRKAEGSS